jgi:hypothetical protein
MSVPANALEVSGVDEGSGLWLHAVIAGRQPVPEIAGIDGHPVGAIRSGDLTAVVSSVPMSEYGEEALRRHLEDLDWLERTARAHHVVVDALSRAGPVVPARLATVYRDEDRVAAALADHRTDFSAALDRIAGRTEWGVKGYSVPAAAAPPEEPGGSAGAGTAYLRKRRAQLTAREESQQAAVREAAVIHTALGGLAEAARRHPPQDRRLSGVDTAMVLNGAYLVETDRTDAFTGLVEALSRRHPAIRLELTGPWPPYSFTGDDDPTVVTESGR